ncbi:MAG: helix-turn-helix domain-containing protein [Sedimentisphaerales bacterium]|nr:helix-turn-helix domain-containing protein [Sedimentisphaerales bacterium]
MERRLLTIRETGRILSLSERKTWGLVYSGDLPCIRMGRSVRVDRNDLEAFIDAKKCHGREKPKPVQTCQRERLPVSGHGESFEKFWKAYPKKTGKAEARRIWKRLKPSRDLSKIIMEAIRKQKQSEQWQAEQGRFIPKPSRWLSEERWNDELPKKLDCIEQFMQATGWQDPTPEEAVKDILAAGMTPEKQRAYDAAHGIVRNYR